MSLTTTKGVTLAGGAVLGGGLSGAIGSITAPLLGGDSGTAIAVGMPIGLIGGALSALFPAATATASTVLPAMGSGGLSGAVEGGLYEVSAGGGVIDVTRGVVTGAISGALTAGLFDQIVVAIFGRIARHFGDDVAETVAATGRAADNAAAMMRPGIAGSGSNAQRVLLELLEVQLRKGASSGPEH